jgi:hypothetical protein
VARLALKSTGEPVTIALPPTPDGRILVQHENGRLEVTEIKNLGADEETPR